MANLDKVLTIGEVAAILRVHPATVYRLVKKGELPACKIGSSWRINPKELDAWLAAGSPTAPGFAFSVFSANFTRLG